MIAAAILKATEKLREEGQTSGRGGEKKGKTRQPLPWNHFLTDPNSVSFNVKGGSGTLMSLFDIFYTPNCSKIVIEKSKKQRAKS